MSPNFDDYDYTRESIIKQATLIELHSKDGSATEAGCGCIEGKHLYILEGLAEEMVGFAKTQKEKEFYAWVGDVARNIRRKIEFGDFCIPCNPAPNHNCNKARECVAKN